METMNVAEIIQDWLFREDRTQAQLARMAKVNVAVLSRIMTGKQIPGPKVCRRLEMAMNLERGALFAIQAQAPLPIGESPNGHAV